MYYYECIIMYKLCYWAFEDSCGGGNGGGGGGGVMKVCLLGVCSLRHNPFNWLPSYYKKTFICLYAAQDTRKWKIVYPV